MTRTPPGWYADPWRPSALRFWDGQNWTPAIAPRLPPASAPPALTAPAGTDGNTVWIWLVVLVPVVPSLLMLLVPWEGMFAFDPMSTDLEAILRAQLAPFLSPVLWISSVLSYAVIGVCVYFAYLDYRALESRQVPRPVHWGWAFLSSVYPIARSIVVKRRTGRGLAPLWGAIGVIAFGFVVGGVIAYRVIAGVLDMLAATFSSLA